MNWSKLLSILNIITVNNNFENDREGFGKGADDENIHNFLHTLASSNLPSAFRRLPKSLRTQ